MEGEAVVLAYLCESASLTLMPDQIDMQRLVVAGVEFCLNR